MLPWVNGPVLGIPLCPLFASTCFNSNFDFPSDPIRPPTPRVHFPEVSRERTGVFRDDADETCGDRCRSMFRGSLRGFR